MKQSLFTILAGLTLLALSSCGSYPSAPDGGRYGSVSVRVWVNAALSKSQRAAQTTWDSLILVVSATDITPVYRSFALNPLQTSVLDTIDGIAEGDNRRVEGWTCTRDGLRIHYGLSGSVSVTAGQTTPVAMQLRPVRGSIYISLADVPANVDSVFATFYFHSDSLGTKDKRSALMYLSIDNVPDSSDGVLVIRGTDLSGSTIYCDSLALLFRTEQNVTMQAQFLAKQGGLSLDISLQRPGVTVVSGQMAGEPAPGAEAGPLIISEIMYYTDGDSDYIEIHNPSSTVFAAETLILEIVNTSSTTTCRLGNVSIPSGGFLVVGDSDAPAAWVDTTCAMDLTTTGRWISLKSTGGALIDWVSYARNDQEWPNCPKYHSIELALRSTDPQANNYGCAWVTAAAAIGGSDCFGTPGQ
jgi:hypothetical protein